MYSFVLRSTMIMSKTILFILVSVEGIYGHLQPAARSNIMRERAKHNRREMIKAQVEQVLNVGNHPSGEEQIISWNNLKRQFDYEEGLPNPTASSLYSDYTEKLRSLFPTCILPARVQRFISNRRIGMHLYFDVRPSSVSKNGYHLDVSTGRLHLFKMYPKSSKNGQLVDKKVRITVSWMKRRNRSLEYVMLDSKMELLKSNRWISLDVLLAVRYWHRRPRKNLGLIVEVEDMDQNVLSAEDFIARMNCSDTITPAFPSILDSRSTMNSSINSKLYPLLDISTVELPNFEEVPSEVSLLSLRQVSLMDEGDDSFNEDDDTDGDGDIKNEKVIDEENNHLMKFPIFGSNNRQVTSSGMLKKIEDVSFMDQDPNLSEVVSSDKPIFRPILQRIIRNREELISALKTLVNEESSQLDLQRNILDTIDIEEKIMNKLTSSTSSSSSSNAQN